MRRRRILAGLLALAAWLAGGGVAMTAPPSEQQVKAAFLLKFAPFVTWPGGAAAASAPVVVCVVGQDPFGAGLGRLARQSGAGRSIVTRRMAVLERDAGCDVAYLAGGPRQSVADGLREAAGAPILTVTDEVTGDRDQGMIHFVVRDRRVRFIVDQGAARRGGLALSSKLLSLAVTVRP
jgi:hypothetical protein